jgi:DNA-binding transcriptional LysR family regulator
VLPWGHRLATDTGPLDLLELADESWIQCASQPCRLLLERAARSAGFTPAVAFHTDDYPTAIALVEAGVGVALLPAIALLSLPDGVCARPLSRPELTRNVLAAVGDREDRSPAVDEMLEILAGSAAAYASRFARDMADLPGH